MIARRFSNVQGIINYIHVAITSEMLIGIVQRGIMDTLPSITVGYAIRIKWIHSLVGSRGTADAGA